MRTKDQKLRIQEGGTCFLSAYKKKKPPFGGPFLVCAMHLRRRYVLAYAEKAKAPLGVCGAKLRLGKELLSLPLYAELVSLLRLGKELRIQGKG